MGAKVNLAFWGDLSGSLARQLGGEVSLNPFNGTLTASDAGILVDGTQASAPDEKALRAIFEAGKMVAISRPSAASLNILTGITGQAPAPGVPLVTYRRSTGRAGYRVNIVPEAKIRSKVFGRSPETPSAQGSDSTAAGSPNISAALVRAATVSAAAISAGPSSPGLIPPLASTAGYSSFIYDPAFNTGTTDDSSAGGSSQYVDSSALTEFYVYWVNGGYAPYYVVIVRQTGTWSVGGVIVNNANSLGWFQGSFGVWANLPTNSSQQPITQGLQSQGYSPVTTNTTNTNAVNVGLVVPMTLIADQPGGGTGSVQFNATVNDAISYPSWNVLNNSSANTNSWWSYQNSPWNILQYAPNDFHDWWSNTSLIYDSNGNMVPQADASLGSINYESVSAWAFSPPLFTAPAQSPFTPPPSVVIWFSGGWDQDLYLAHNPSGCNNGHHHLFSYAQSWGWNWYMDLGAVAAQQNLAGG